METTAMRRVEVHRHGATWYRDEKGAVCCPECGDKSPMLTPKSPLGPGIGEFDCVEFFCRFTVLCQE